MQWNLQPPCCWLRKRNRGCLLTLEMSFCYCGLCLKTLELVKRSCLRRSWWMSPCAQCRVDNQWCVKSVYLSRLDCVQNHWRQQYFNQLSFLWAPIIPMPFSMWKYTKRRLNNDEKQKLWLHRMCSNVSAICWMSVRFILIQRLSSFHVSYL